MARLVSRQSESLVATSGWWRPRLSAMASRIGRGACPPTCLIALLCLAGCSQTLWLEGRTGGSVSALKPADDERYGLSFESLAGSSAVGKGVLPTPIGGVYALGVRRRTWRRGQAWELGLHRLQMTRRRGHVRAIGGFSFLPGIGLTPKSVGFLAALRASGGLQVILTNPRMMALCLHVMGHFEVGGAIPQGDITTGFSATVGLAWVWRARGDAN